MPMPTYDRIPPTTRSFTAGTTLPIATTYAAAKLEANGYSDNGDGVVATRLTSAKSVTARYYDTAANKWTLLGATAAKQTVAFVAESMDVWKFPRSVLVHFTVDATTSEVYTSARVVV